MSSSSGGLRQLDNYVQAAIQEPFNVLGLELRPLSLGHVFLMRRFDCPFASDDPNQMGGCPDLCLATLICSRTYEGFLEFINNRELQLNHFWELPEVIYNKILDTIAKVRKWHLPFFLINWFIPMPTYTARWLHKWDKTISKAFKKKKLDAIEQFQRFNEYRQTDIYIPYYTILVQGGSTSGAHWSMNIYQFMTKELGYSKSEALNMPLAQAIVEYYKGLETVGTIQLHNDFECAVDEQLIKQ
jgi:hypothetical protein